MIVKIIEYAKFYEFLNESNQVVSRVLKHTSEYSPAWEQDPADHVQQLLAQGATLEDQTSLDFDVHTYQYPASVDWSRPLKDQI